MMNKAISAVVLATLVGASCFLCGCYATRNMNTKVDLASVYHREQNEKVPASIGIIMEPDAFATCVSYWDWYGGKVFTYDWTRNKLLELGNNFFQKAEITERIGGGKYDLFAKVYDNFSFRWGTPVYARVSLGLYSSDGTLINTFKTENSSYQFTYPPELFLSAILEGGSLFVLTPVLKPLGNYRLASHMDKKMSYALNAAYSSLFEEVSDYIISQQKGRRIRVNETRGTGFAISPEHIVTAFHVVNGVAEVEVKFDNGEWIKAEVIENLANNDIAILKVNDKLPHWISLPEEEKCQVGERLFTYGYPSADILGSEIKFSEGVLNSLSGVRGDKSQCQISIPIQPGNSGSPVISEKGYLIGVITSTVAVDNFYRQSQTLPQNINWATKLFGLRQMLGSGYTFPNTRMPTSRDELLEVVRKSTCMVRSKRTKE